MSTIVAMPPEAVRRAESVLAGRTEVTPEELLAMPDGKHYELVDGVPAADQNKPYVDKYTAEISRAFGTPENFASRYPVPLRIRITRVR